jgi:hypothetical protein
MPSNSAVNDHAILLNNGVQVQTPCFFRLAVADLGHAAMSRELSNELFKHSSDPNEKVRRLLSVL